MLRRHDEISVSSSDCDCVRRFCAAGRAGRGPRLCTSLHTDDGHPSSFVPLASNPLFDVRSDLTGPISARHRFVMSTTGGRSWYPYHGQGIGLAAADAQGLKSSRPETVVQVRDSHDRAGLSAWPRRRANTELPAVAVQNIVPMAPTVRTPEQCRMRSIAPWTGPCGVHAVTRC